MYEKRVIEYNLNNFLTNINNGYFRDKKGNLCKFTRIAYNSDKKSAEVDFWVNYNYPTNLIETYYEPTKGVT